MLEIDSVDWHLLENAKAHHTDKYEVVHEESIPVLRRAQPFKLSITFNNRPFNEAIDRVRLFFLYGIKKITPRIQSLIEDTTVTSFNKINKSLDKWSLELIKTESNNITLLVRSPPTAAWNLCNLSIKTSLVTSAKTQHWKSPNNFYLIYNPWNEDDEVYMSNTRYLDEYILNDIGKVYTSSAKKPIGMKWMFGQFAAPVIKVMTRMISDKDSDLSEEDLGSPNKLCHFLIRNVEDIVLGDWSGNYSEGTAPWLWTGSVPIFEEYLKTGKSVKYGQCFTYSAVFTTALRAVGIPVRSITNFISAISAYNLSVNEVYNKDGQLVSSSSIWNFHCWNDVWFARYDLPPGYGGWQAADASNFAGPASVQAIKKGEVLLSHDARHFSGEINADKIRWTIDENDEYHLVEVDTKHVGRALLTKSPYIYDPHGDTDFQDVKHNYKEAEGSKEERLAVYNAIKHCKILDAKDEVNHLGNIPYHVDIATINKTVKFKIIEIDTVSFGEPFSAEIQLENVGEKTVNVETSLRANSTFYHGATAGLVKKQLDSIQLNPGTTETISMQVSAEQYAEKLVEFTILKIICLATIKETNYSWVDEHSFVVDMPEIIIFARDELKVGEEGTVTFRIMNLLNTKLTKCKITFQAPGIGNHETIKCRDIDINEEMDIEHKVKPAISGELVIKAIFTSKELHFMCGSSLIDVDP